MKHEIIAPGVEIYCGDCLDILPGLSADHIVTDPPYEEVMQKAVGKFKDIRSDGKSLTVRKRHTCAASATGLNTPLGPLIWSPSSLAMQAPSAAKTLLTNSAGSLRRCGSRQSGIFSRTKGYDRTSRNYWTKGEHNA